MVDKSAQIINFEGREAKGLSKGRYDETFAGEDDEMFEISYRCDKTISEVSSEVTAPKGTVQSGSILYVIYTSKVYLQII